MTAQSNAEPQTLRDAAENLLIAIGMGWDLDGCVENLRAALAQSDAEPGDRFRTSYNRFCANAQSDAKERREEELREDERLGAALRRAQDAEDRLAALAQSGAGPVAWQWRAKYTNGWSKWTEASEEVAKCNGSQGQCEWRALYAASPCPAASAGLIEAAEWSKLKSAEKHLEDVLQYPLGGVYIRTGIQAALVRLKEVLRSRAADRSGK